MAEKQSTRIRSLLDLSSRYLFQGAAYISLENRRDILLSHKVCKFCQICLEQGTTGGYCRQAITSGAYQALQTGEPHYFRCWIGLNSVVLPIAPGAGNKLTGAIELGGFYYPEDFRENQQFVESNIARLGVDSTGRLQAAFNDIKTVSSTDIRGYATFMFESLFSSGINAVERFRERHEKYLQQRRIAELMHNYGDQVSSLEDVFGLFSALTIALKFHDRKRIMLLLDDFFSRVLLLSSGNINQIKAHVNLLFSVLAREAVIHGDIPLERAVNCQVQAFRELGSLTELEDICFRAYQHVDQYLKRIGESSHSCDDLSARVVAWLYENYSGRVTLTQAAEGVSASVSSIVKTLPAKTGKTFHQHLVAIRLSVAKELLATSNMPISEVALRCGFCDQSHLTRSFTQEFNITPRRFRIFSLPSS